MRSMKPAQTKPTKSSPKPLRSDGVEARNRLLDAALQLFADKGFAKASTREIAQAAQVNVASISYYFGDKRGLYQAVFEDPRYNPEALAVGSVSAPQDIRTTLDVLLRGFVEPLKSGEQARLCMKLHFREMIEPTGMWQKEIEGNIKPAHEALVQALCRHWGMRTADDDVHRLAFDIAGLGIMLHVGIDVLQAVRPALIATPQALDTYHHRLVERAMALVDAEAARRAASGLGKTAQPRQKKL